MQVWQARHEHLVGVNELLVENERLRIENGFLKGGIMAEEERRSGRALSLLEVELETVQQENTRLKVQLERFIYAHELCTKALLDADQVHLADESDIFHLESEVQDLRRRVPGDFEVLALGFLLENSRPIRGIEPESWEKWHKWVASWLGRVVEAQP